MSLLNIQFFTLISNILNFCLDFIKQKTKKSSQLHLPLQSFIRRNPKMWSWASWMGIGCPCLLPGPTKKAISSSMSRSLEGPCTGGLPVGGEWRTMQMENT